jgi:hypothetical protein
MTKDKECKSFCLKYVAALSFSLGSVVDALDGPLETLDAVVVKCLASATSFLGKPEIFPLVFALKFLTRLFAKGQIFGFDLLL